MGARPSTARKSGGGLWKGSVGTITGYRWTDELGGTAFVPGKKPGTKDDKFHSLFLELTIRKDGEEEDRALSLFAGGYDDYEISGDELTLTNPEGGECSLGDNTGAMLFMSSFCANPPASEEMFSEDTDSVNYEPIIGSRVKFDEVVALDKNGDPRKRVAKKGKFAGKEFSVTNVIVAEVYEVAGSKTKGRVAAKSTQKVNGRVAKPAVADEIDVAEVAATSLLQYLEGAPGKKLNVGKLRTKVLTDPQFKGNQDLAKEVIEWLADDDNYASISEITYNAKTQVIELDA